MLVHVFSFYPPESIQQSINYTQVCASWRTVAYSAPELWTTLAVKCPVAGLHTEQDRASYKKMLVDWILRSRDVSMSLTVQPPLFLEARMDASVQLQAYFYETICQDVAIDFRQKWRCLCFPPDWDFHDLVSRLSDTVVLEHLEELMFAIRGCTTSPDRHDYFPLSSRLHTLQLTLIDVDSFSCVERTVPWPSHTLYLTSWGDSVIRRDVIRGCLQLGRLQDLVCLDIDGIEWENPGVLPSTTLPHLRNLTVDGTIIAMGDLMGALTLPSLETMFLSIYGNSSDHGPVVGPALAGLLRRSSHRNFGLYGLYLGWMLAENDLEQAISFESLGEIFSIANTIEELYISPEGMIDASRLMDLLCYDISNPARQLLPSLRLFQGCGLSEAQEPQNNVSHFVSFVHSRWSPENPETTRSNRAARLQTVTLLQCDLASSTKDQLQTCHDAGLEFKFFS
ncbi:hypothetical protein C8R42DRAFT_686255 [Lentinula raphanica]|nr:hypothetical protein C8R42DRAFT_686255 [Lentinula raphanica]